MIGFQYVIKLYSSLIYYNLLQTIVFFNFSDKYTYYIIKNINTYKYSETTKDLPSDIPTHLLRQ